MPYRNGTMIDPDFKDLVARVCRGEAAALARAQRHTEAAAKIAAAERLEAQAAAQRIEDAIEIAGWEARMNLETA